MKSLFQGFYQSTEEEFKSLWQHSLFIFDTNVLLNLYRYQSSTRDSLLKVMEKVEDRVWIPYHVGLEFHRNRLKVIAEQHKRFTEVRGIVEKTISEMSDKFDALQLKTRHSHINPDQLISNFQKVQSDFFDDLKKLEEKSISINSSDEIMERIERLFQNAIGEAPLDQKNIDKIFSEGERRYESNIPPGFKDSSKGDKESDEFSYGGITYKRKYGDLIIWYQIIAHACENGIKKIIFITDDNKADWWWKVDSNGTKNLGVRPELKDEIQRKADVDSFHAYNTERFLSYANEQLDAQVTEEVIKEVREISKTRRNATESFRGFGWIRLRVERSLFEWLTDNYFFARLDLDTSSENIMPIIGYQDTAKYGFLIKLIDETGLSRFQIRKMLTRARHLIEEESLYEVGIFFVSLNEEETSSIKHKIYTALNDAEKNFKGRIRIYIGASVIREDEEAIPKFVLDRTFLVSDVI